MDFFLNELPVASEFKGQDSPKIGLESIPKMDQKKQILSPAERLKRVREYVRIQRGLDKLSQNDFAEALGESPHRIRHIEAGDNDISTKLARSIAAKTGFELHWLLTGEGAELQEGMSSQVESIVKSFDIPCGPGNIGFSPVPKIKALVSGGMGEFVYEEQCEELYSFRTDWLSRKGVVSAMRLAEVSGDSMLPTLNNGDFVLFDTSRPEPRDGKIMVVGVGNHLLIKRIRISPDGIFLLSDNREVYEPVPAKENTRFLGLVIWHCGEI